jgi:hypothetical protein
MRIHTDILTADDVRACRPINTGLGFDRLEPRGSRSHRGAYDVHLAAVDNHGRDAWEKKRRPNTGIGWESSYPYAATWGEWGLFLAALFELDPVAYAGPYRGRDDFHAQTRGVFRASVSA